jgi:hypothetical protein
MSNVRLETVFLNPGTIISYVEDGVTKQDTVKAEVEVPFVSFEGNRIYQVKWTTASGEFLALAVEPSPS